MYVELRGGWVGRVMAKKVSDASGSLEVDELRISMCKS